MNDTLGNFIKNLENWENFKADKYKSSKKNELNYIAKLQREKNLESLLELIKTKTTQDFFELPHPTLENVQTRAIYNIQYGINNFVFMVDKDNLHPWLFAQCLSFMDLIILEGTLFKMSLFNCSTIYPEIKKLSTIESNKINFSEKKFGLLLYHRRPYHFFYDELKYWYFLKKDTIDILQEDAFFQVNHPTLNSENLENNKVFLFPTTISNTVLLRSNNLFSKQLDKDMETKIYKEALKNYHTVDSSNDTIKLWYGIMSEKRSWLEQVDGCIEIINNLLEYFPKIILIIDGMTATEGKTIKNKDDLSIYKQIEQKLDTRCILHSVLGQDYKHKIQVCSTIDLFITSEGTDCIVPLRFCEKPGVLHSNNEVFSFPYDYPENVKKVDSRYITKVINKKQNGPGFVSYKIPWQHIYNLTAEVINMTKGTNINMLKVPVSIEALQQENKKTFKSFQNLVSIIGNKEKIPDILREVALSFEESGDIETALAIMQQALKLRPNGPLLQKKVAEYKDKLKEKESKT